MERRQSRSSNAHEAARLLVDALATRSSARAVAVVDAAGRVVVGKGSAPDLAGLARVASAAAEGAIASILDLVPSGTDVFSRKVALGDETVYLAALGTRMRRFAEAASGLTRIFAAS